MHTRVCSQRSNPSIEARVDERSRGLFLSATMVRLATAVHMNLSVFCVRYLYILEVALIGKGIRMTVRLLLSQRLGRAAALQPRQSKKLRHMAAQAAKAALVPVADGSEEMEAVIIIDVLRRAGVDVHVASVEPQLTVTASRGVKIEADYLIDAIDRTYDAIVLPVRSESGSTDVDDRHI